MRKTINLIVIFLSCYFLFFFSIDAYLSYNLWNFNIQKTVKVANLENKSNSRDELEIDKNDSRFILKDIQISFLWDVMIWNRVRDKIDQNWLSYSFSWTSQYLSKKNAVVLNLETPVTDNWKVFNKTYTFKAKKEHLSWLKSFNKNILVNLANNHIWDYWEEGILNTFENLDDYEIKYFWAGKNKSEADSIKILELENLKIWFIWQVCIWPNSYEAGYNRAWSSFLDKEVIKNEIKKWRELWADIIVYNMHCWDEYTNWPNAIQKEYAHFVIDNWVDLVIWHHPHRYQPIEIYKDKLIFYSLWDYIFDIFRWRRTNDWIIANIIIKNKKIVKAEIEVVHITDFWNTNFVSKKDKDFVLNELYELSKKLWDIETIKDWYIKL